MILEPYYAMLKALHTYQEFECNSTYSKGTEPNKIGYPYNSNMYNYPYEMMRFARLGTYSTGYSTQGVIFGDGTSEVSRTDSWISGNQITNLSVSGTRTYEMDDSGITYIGTYTITNATETDVVIGEVGYIHNLPMGSAAYSHSFLIDRTLLDEPLTVAANGGLAQIVYKIRVDYPTA